MNSLVGSRFEGSVRGLSTEGRGIVEHPEGRVIFVPGVWPGDEGTFQIVSVAKRYGVGRLLELRQPSPERVKAPCAYQGFEEGASCGGCPWMIGSYESQLAHKAHRVRHAFERAGLTPPNGIPDLWPSQPLGYRNRAQFKTDGEKLGFVAEESHSLVPVEDCLVLNEPTRAHLKSLRAKLPNPAWRPSKGYPWIFLEVDDELPVGEFPTPNRRRAFRQGNTAQNEQMKRWVREHALEAKDARVLELFAGSGNFTEALIDAGAAKVWAVDVQGEALDRLAARSWSAVEILSMNLFHEAAWRHLARDTSDVDLLFLDPPRAGAKGVERLVAKLPFLKKIIYVSCDLPSLVRDLSALKGEGFVPTEVQALDAFPHTAHVEILTELRR